MAQALTRHFNPSIFALTNKYIRLKMHFMMRNSSSCGVEMPSQSTGPKSHTHRHTSPHTDPRVPITLIYRTHIVQMYNRS